MVAHDLVAAGDADAMVVVAAEDVGNSVRALFSAAGFPVPETGAAACVLCRAQVGMAGVSRAALSSLLHEARAEGGALGGARPGYPSFLEALSRLQSPEG